MLKKLKSSRYPWRIAGSVYLILGILLVSSCIQDLRNDIDKIGQITWNPTLGITATSGSFTFTDFEEELSSGNLILETGNDGLLVLVYKNDSLFSQTAENIITIDDQTFNTFVSIDLPTLNDLPVLGTISHTENFNFNINTPNNDQLDSAALKGGGLQLNLSGDFPASGSITLTFGSIKEAGSVLQRTFSWTYDGSNPSQTFSELIDLNGIFMDFTNGGTTTNQFDFSISITLTFEGQTVSVTNGMGIDIAFSNAKFQSVFGTLNTQQITSQIGDFVLDINSNIDGGSYFFDDPKIIFNIENSFGAPLDIVINEVRGIGGTGPVSLTGSIVSSPVSIGFPAIANIGQSVSTDVIIDNTNSNLPVLISSQPDNLNYDFEGMVNSSGTGGTHFVLDTSRLSMKAAFELPIFGRIFDLTLIEGYDFDGSLLEDSDNALLRLTTTNGFPLDIDVQAYFFDSNRNFLDSLIYDDSRVVESGIVDGNGKVTTPTDKSIDIMLSKDRIDLISRATRVQLRTILNTPDNSNQSIKIFNTDEIRLSLFVQTQFEFTF